MCDTLAVRRSSGTLFAKSSDRPVGEVQVVEAHPRRPAGRTLATQYLTLPDAGAAAVIGSRPTWLWGFEHGVNEHRLAVGNERVWTVRDDEAAEPALIGMDLVRLVLERAEQAEAGVDVLVELLERHGQGGVADATAGEGYHSSFLLADPRSAWVVETCGRTWAARQTRRDEPGACVSNRLSLTDDWDRASADVAPGTTFQAFRHATFPTGHADRRLAVTGAAVADTGVSTADLAAVLRDHGGPPWGEPGRHGSGPAPVPPPPRRIEVDGTGVTVCMHLRGWEATAASMVAWLPADPDVPVRLFLSLGSPCVGVFVPCVPFVDPAAPTVPDVVGDDRTWGAVDALRAHVEAATDADRSAGAALLAGVRAVLDPVEDELWWEAGQLDGRDAGAVAAFHRRASEAVRQALARATLVADAGA